MKLRSVAGLCSAIVVSALVAVVVPPPGATADPAGATYTVLGQPNTSSDTLLSRCAQSDARFNQHNFGGGFSTAGPTGVVVTPAGRLFAVDDGGQRVLSWPDADALASCQSADKVIGSSAVLTGPEGLAVGPDGSVYVADTLQHVVEIFTPDGNGDYPATPQVVLGESWTSGSAGNQFYFPRGLALDDAGRLFVADDYNNRIQIFHPPFTTGQFADDGIGAGNNGGFSNPKDIAFAGGSLFVADFWAGRVLRFPAPFDNPATVYTADATFTGVGQPVNLTVSSGGTLFVTDGGSGGAPSVKEYPGATTGGDQAAAVDEHTFGGLLTGPSPDNGAQPEPLGVAVTPAGRLVVADYAGYRLVIESTPSAGNELDVNTAVPSGRVQKAYKTKLTATGGSGGLKWSVTNPRDLPPGIKLSTGGVLSGKPTTPGTYPVEVLVHDASTPVRTGDAVIVVVVDPMDMTYAGPTGLIGTSFKGRFRAIGGKSPRFNRVAGTIPPGLKLKANGQLAGTPTVPGTFDLTVLASDKGVPQNLRALTVTIQIQPFTFSLPPSAVFVVGHAVAMKPTVTGGKKPLHWSIESGALPPGLKISGGSGQISGTPTTLGSYDFRVYAADSTKSPGPNQYWVDANITVVP